MAAAATPQPSPADVAVAGLGHPLGSMRLTTSGFDLRLQWTLLAARLADTPDEIARVYEQIRTLLPQTTGGDARYLTYALQAIPPHVIVRDAPLLASHLHWALPATAGRRR